MFLLPKDGMKGKCYVFSAYKERIKVTLYYFECKQQEDMYIDAFSNGNARKRQKEHNLRQENNKQGTANVFQCESAQRKITILLFDSVNKEARYSVCI